MNSRHNTFKMGVCKPYGAQRKVCKERTQQYVERVQVKIRSSAAQKKRRNQ